VVRALGWTGIALVVGSTALAAMPAVSLFTLGLTAWALVPWGLLRFLTARLSDPWALSTAALGLLLGEASVRATVFLFPRGSTASLLLLFSPRYLAVAVLPGSASAGCSERSGGVRGWPAGRCSWGASPR
jgi:hypothetical protein